MNILIYVLAFTGGFVIMSLELLGSRIMAPYFGGSIYVWGSIITIFMLSLSLGYLAGGRWSTRQPSMRKFGSIFLIAGTCLVPLVSSAEILMSWIFEHVEDPRYGSLLAATMLFMLPTVVLGMISPYSVRLLVTNVASSGKVAGSLYFISTLGSALGTLFTSFYLVLWLELTTILYLLSGILLSMFVITALASTRSTPLDISTTATTS